MGNYYLYEIKALIHGILLRTGMKKSSDMQQDADIYLLLIYSICFGRQTRSSSGVHKTVVAAAGTHHTTWGKRFLKRDHTLQNPHIHTPTHYKTHTYKHPHIIKPTHTHTQTLQNPHIHTPTHYKSHTYTQPHITKPTHTNTHTL